MKRNSILLAACAAMAMGAFASEASAQTNSINNGQYPVRLVLRPQTVPMRMARFDASFDVTRFSSCISVLGSTTCASATGTALNLGGAFGLTNDLEVGATVLPLQLTEDFAYNNPSIYGRFQFLNNGQLQVSGQLTLTVPVRDGSKLGLGVALPVWYNASDQLQIRTGVYYNATFSDPVSHGISVPLQFHVNLDDYLFGSLNTGIDLPFKDTGDNLNLPLGVAFGYTLAGTNARPLADVSAYFNFPLFLRPGASGDKVFTDIWTAGLVGRYYLPL